MENILNIIVLLLVIAASVISSVNRRKKEYRPMEEYIPAPPSQNTRKQNLTPTQSAPSPQQKIPPKPTKRQEEASPKPSRAAEEIIDKFDIRTAIIYSEILSPKYKEY